MPSISIENLDFDLRTDCARCGAPLYREIGVRLGHGIEVTPEKYSELYHKVINTDFYCDSCEKLIKGNSGNQTAAKS